MDTVRLDRGRGLQFAGPESVAPPVGISLDVGIGVAVSFLASLLFQSWDIAPRITVATGR